MNGKKINYIPGWDCHGLPIELKALAEGTKASPLEIRTKCAAFAKEALERQKSGFKEWGVAADWELETSTYQTNRPGYVSNQLQLFYEFYQKGLVFRDLKPVFWSPSSKSALAEAELEYDNNHESPSVFLQLKLENVPDAFAVIWTTTPWTLPSNQAVCYNPSLEYALVYLDGNTSKKYLIATSLITSFSETTNMTIDISETISGKDLQGFRYQHPVDSKILPFIAASHVEDSKGTGLVHTAPAHGPDDFLISLEHKIPVLSLVDEEGKYTSKAPDFLVGKQVLEEGNKLVMEKASEQWFMNTESLKTRATEEIEKIKIYPRVNEEANRKMLMTQVQKRPYWCISRQRSWGVPIPVFYKKDTKEIVLNREIVDCIANLVSKEGSIDFWWSKNPSEIISPDILGRLEISPENLVKGNDIFDIWFDSGTSWSSVLGENKIADLYLEGYDQFTGWFQSSLLTSVAHRNCAPYKSLFVHGFTVDDKGLKMSKSLGNVISPSEIIKKFGTDSLRWWVAAHGTQHMSITVSNKLLQQSAESVSKIRATLRYLNGVLGEGDRLYCGMDEDLAQIKSVLKECYLILNKAIWPVTPFLVEESWSYFDSSAPFYKNKSCVENDWENKEAEQIVTEALNLKRKINQMESTNSWLLHCSVNCTSEQLQYLSKLQPKLSEFVNNSELCEILQVGSVKLEESMESSIELKISETPLCPRCRRFQCHQGGVCERCLIVMKSKGF
uniref:isoleucine--tRNA ligase n=1 Tax=Megaselia scalaris TaxID=36166 RepID=T1GHN0_MEGSC